jgi:hypothetical protein
MVIPNQDDQIEKQYIKNIRKEKEFLTVMNKLRCGCSKNSASEKLILDINTRNDQE